MAKKQDYTECTDPMVVGTILTNMAMKSGEDVITTFGDWLEWMTKVYDIHNLYDSDEGIVGAYQRAKEDNEAYFDAMTAWLSISNRYQQMGKMEDALGVIYEANFQTSGKASKLGQFFTPMSLSDLMAETLMDGRMMDGVVRYHDCACGSGRTLISAWNKCDRYAKNYFNGGDIDHTSVKMCALNFLVNGMIGTVDCMDALTQDWHYGYIVNGIKVPFSNNMASLEKVTDRAEYEKKKNVLLYWIERSDIERYRPTDEAVDGNVCAELKKNTPKETKVEEPKDGNPGMQLSLF